MANVSVILPAAGASARFGTGRNKIFELLDDQPVFVHAVRLFSQRPDVAQVLLVVAGSDRDEIIACHGAFLDGEGVTIVIGGTDRSESIRNALPHVTGDAELICIHDAVRPVLAPEWIDAVFAAADEYGAAILASPVRETLKRSAGELIAETVDRSDIWQAQTPQVFRADWLVEAYAAGGSASDDAALVEQAGHPVHLVAGDARNIKITTPPDLAFAAAALRTLQ